MIFKCFRKNLPFVIESFFAKLGIILFYILTFFNFGLLYIFRYRERLFLDTAFVLSVVFSSLFGLLTIPSISYLMGLIAVLSTYLVSTLGFLIKNKKLSSKMFVKICVFNLGSYLFFLFLLLFRSGLLVEVLKIFK